MVQTKVCYDTGSAKEIEQLTKMRNWGRKTNIETKMNEYVKKQKMEKDL